MPSPIIEFRKFAHPQLWWLRRGPPPWLDDPRWEARAFRATVFFGLLGVVSGGLGAIEVVSFSYLWRLIGGRQGTFEYHLLLAPGFWFGLVTLVPLSRWLGRGWVMTCLAVLIAMLASCCGIIALFFVAPFFGDCPKWIPGGRTAAGFYAGFVGAFLVCLWMGHPKKKLAWLSGMLAVTLATLGCGLLLLRDSPSLIGDLIPQFAEPLAIAQAYQTFQCLTAIGLGVRLWGGVTEETNRT